MEILPVSFISFYFDFNFMASLNLGVMGESGEGGGQVGGRLGVARKSPLQINLFLSFQITSPILNFQHNFTSATEV